MYHHIRQYAVIGIASALASALTLSAVTAAAQDYPIHPIRIVTSEPGGGTDFVSRLVAQGITAPMGQQVIVDNRPSGPLIGELVAKAPPDGYTVFLNGSAFWLLPFLQSNTPYDPVRDFSPVTLATVSPNVLVVHPALPVKTVKDLIALAKAKPGQLNYGSSSAGTPTHLGAELFNSMASVNIVRVPYKGNGPAINALIGGETQIMFANVAAVAPHTKSGRLHALAVGSLKPSDLAPGLPTVASSGLPGYESVSTYGVFAPAKTPSAIIARLNSEIIKILKRPETKERLTASGVEAVGSTPEELFAAMKTDMVKMGKLIKDRNIHAD